MEDVELSDLVKRFQSLQKEQITNLISERNAVEIVNALIQKKLVDLLFTTDAKEYLTWDELRREIVDEVLANGGRLNVVDLPGLLSVHTFQVERVLPRVLEENPSLTLEGGELMTADYLDSIVLAAGDLLKEQGSLAIAQFASTNQLSSLFSKNLLSRGMDRGRIDAVMQDASLYTRQFVRLQRTVVRAGLLAAESPVRLDAFYKRHGLFSPLMTAVVDELRGELPGSWDGYNTYVPLVYETRRAAELQNLYASNGCVEYAALQRQEIQHPRQYLVDRYNPPDAAAVATTSSAPANQRKGRRRGAGGRPTAAATRDAVPRVTVRASADYPLCGYPLTNGFVSDRLLSHLPALQSLVDGEAVAVDVAEQLPLFVEVERDWPLLEERLRELYPGLESATLIANSVLVDTSAAEATVMAALPAALAMAAKSRVPASAAAADTIASVLKLPRDRYGEAIRELADLWGEAVAAVQQQLAMSASKSAAAELKQTRAALQEELAARWVRLWVSAKGVEWALAQLDEPTASSIVRHIMATEAYELARLVLRNESLDTPEWSERVAAALEQVSQPAQLKKALLPFSENRRSSLSPIVDGVSGKSLEVFLDSLRDMSGAGVIAVASFHAPNKKTERDVYAKMRESVVEEVRAASASRVDAGANGKLLASLCTLLVHQRFRCHVELPGKAVAGVVSRLRTEAEMPPTLESAKESVAAALQHGTVDDAAAAALEELRAATLALC
ncbi:CG1104 protein-like protein [Novymonas esmeraldas]|uniref:CG1104 protein-like protein n=1 Tax=Novymonas esmeraldas TaxID=1808958 RepID=A0AAW0FEX4_9TRYP